jgi:hypothetical protein
MKLLDMGDLKQLLTRPESPCVSIYMPTERAGKEVSQNAIRFKNMLKAAEKQLRAFGLSRAEIDDFLAPGAKLLASNKFWQYQSDGLAAFICPDSFRYFRLPHRFKELTVVTNRFHIKPLLSVVGLEGRYYILALSQNNVRLFQATRQGASEVELADIPKSLEEALKYEFPEKQLQFHTEGPRRSGMRDSVFYGTGDADPNVKNAILRYFQAVDKGVNALLKEESAPLVLAAVEYLIPIYKKASRCSSITEQSIKGNPDELSADDLNKRAWELIEPRVRRAEEEAAAKYRSLAGSEGKQATNKLPEVVRAAYHGRLESLFVSVGVQQWGTYNPETDEVEMHKKEHPGDQDLLDFAAVHCLSNKGLVFAVEPNRMPDDSPAAAILRY